jgi:Spy/CpxP family protein refolding chaperone
MNVSAVVTILSHKRQENKSEEISKSQAADVNPELSMKYSGRWFRDELQLTREQMKEFALFNPVFRQKVRAINIELAENKEKMLNELTKEVNDTVLLNKLSDSIGQLHAELKKVTYAYYLEFKRICTPEQQEKLYTIFSTMFEGEIPAAGSGQGNRSGRQFGMHRRGYKINN